MRHGRLAWLILVLAIPAMVLAADTLGGVSLGSPGAWNLDYSTYLVGDFNGDGKQDFLKVTSAAWSGVGTVYLSQGDGTFAAKDAGFPGAWNTSILAFYVGDFNGDGKSDVLRQPSSAAGANVTLYLSNSAGAFTQVNLGASVGGKTDYSQFLVGDFNGDGKQDFLMVTNTAWGGVGTTYLSRGDGTFAALNALNPGAWNISYSRFYVGDFNGDGKSDVLQQSNTAGGGKGSLRQSNGDGTFSLISLGADGSWNSDYCQLLVGDFNGDGKLDFLKVTNTAWGGVGTVYLSNGNGTFTARSAGYPGAWNISVCQFQVADFNGDGKSDVLRECNTGGGGNGSVFLSNGDGTFTQKTLISDGSWNTDYAGFYLGDFDGDGRTDLLKMTNTAWGGTGTAYLSYKWPIIP